MSRFYTSTALPVSSQVLSLTSVALMALTALGQGTANPIPGAPPTSSIGLQLEEVIRIPNRDNGSTEARLELLTHAGDGTGVLYVADQFGKLYSFDSTAANPASTLQTVLDMSFVPGFRSTGGQQGFRSFAFHPDHQNVGTPGFRKLYVSYAVPNNGAADHDSVVSELTLGANGLVDESIAPREILRQEQPRGDHNIGKIGFNPNSGSSDDDYGNLYIAFGDGGNYRTDRGDTTLNPNGQDTSNWLGTLLRIDPVNPDSANGTAYTVPADNPFVGDSAFLPEIWAYGLRNPHTFSWDIGGDGKMLIGDIGQSGIEEVNLGIAGANYGWSLREGTFSVEGKLPDSANPILIDPLPNDHATDEFTYPVAQYDHSPGNEGNRLGNAAIAGGFVYRGTQVSELRGKYLFGDFANNHGPIWIVDAEDLDQQEDFTDLTGDHDGGYLASFEELVLLDGNGQPTTLLDIIRSASGNFRLGRNDLRFGQDENGEIYVLNKQDGWIRRFVGTPVPEPSAALLAMVWLASLVPNRSRKPYN